MKWLERVEPALESSDHITLESLRVLIDQGMKLHKKPGSLNPHSSNSAIEYVSLVDLVEKIVWLTSGVASRDRE